MAGNDLRYAQFLQRHISQYQQALHCFAYFAKNFEDQLPNHVVILRFYIISVFLTKIFGFVAQLTYCLQPYDIVSC